jgi:long-chain acyl-CoA synthetase
MVAFRNLGHALSTAVAADAEALIDLSGAEPRTFSYAQIDAVSRAVARGLLGRGLQRGDAVAVMAANRAEFLLTVFGILRAGLLAVPVNHKLPAATVALILRDCAARLVVCDAERRSLCPADIPTVTFDAAGPGSAAGADSFADLLDPGPFDDTAPAADEAAMIIYTSGSTGRPKGVVFSHRGHLWALDMRTKAPVPPGQRMLVAAPLYHQNGLSWCQVALASGGTVVLLPQFSAASYIETAAGYRVSVLTGIPTMIAMVAREQECLARVDLSSVIAVRIGSAPSTEALFQEARRTFPNAAVTNGFGITEGGPVFFGPHPRGLPTPELSVGCAHPEVELRLVHAGQIVPDEGVLQIRSPAVMLRYHNMPDASRKAMTEDGFYITGDIFRRDAEGFFHFVGRADDMFVCGGENVFPGEIEAMLTRHPAVHQASVVPVPDELKGHKPVAFIVLRQGHAASETDIKAYALEHAPAYQHPRRVWFLPELPLAGTNKVDRRKLADLAAGNT